MTTTHTPNAGTPGSKEATVAAPSTTSHTTTVSVVDPAPFGGGTYELRCTCGEHVIYRGEQSTTVEAQRHQAWHAKVGR